MQSKQERITFIVWIALWATATVVRFSFLWNTAGTWDSVDFALALDRYDIFAMQPHFPGYPVFILAGELLQLVYQHPVVALSAVSALSGSLSILVFALWSSYWLKSGWERIWVTALYSFHPLLWVQHVQPMSESLGMLGVLLVLWLVQRSVASGKARSMAVWALAASFVMGLTLGVRVSFFPIMFLLLVPVWHVVRRKDKNEFYWKKGVLLMTGLLLVGCIGVGLWLVPTAATEGGIGSYLELGKQFTEGHFQEWGGTLWTDSSSYMERGWDWLVHRGVLNGWFGLDAITWKNAWVVLGLTPIIVMSILGWLIGYRGQASSIMRLYAVMAIVPYAIWLFVGQNVEKARHILPLVPWLIVGIALGWKQWNERDLWRRVTVAVAGLTLLIMMARGSELVLEAREPLPMVVLMEDLTERYAPGEVVIFTWEEQRVFDYYAPAYATVRVKSVSYWEQSVARWRETGRTMVVTNAVLEGLRAQGELLEGYVIVELGRAQVDPMIEPVYHDVRWYVVK